MFLQFDQCFANVGGQPLVGAAVAPEAVAAVVGGEVGQAVFGSADAVAVRGRRADESPQFAGGLFAAAERVVSELFLVGFGVVGDTAAQAQAGVGEVGVFVCRPGFQALVLVTHLRQGRRTYRDAAF